MEETPLRIAALLGVAAIVAAESCGEPMSPDPETTHGRTDRWGNFTGGRARHSRGGVTRKSRFHIGVKKLRQQKKQERKRRGK